MRGTAIVLSALLLFPPALAQSTSRSEAASVPPQSGSDYTIGIEDLLRVSVWGEAGINLAVRVRPDGKITVPLVNDIKVEGLTPEQVRNELSRRLASVIREPNVTVIVEEINSFRIFVLGEVNRQGPINFYRPTRLLQAIATAGGLTQFAKKEITLLREEGGVEQRSRIDYKQLIAGESTQKNVFLKPGDTLLVE
jgi:polysaccharide export outer membrane protein